MALDPTPLDHLFALLVGALLPLLAALTGLRGFGPEPLSTADKVALYGSNGSVLILLTLGLLLLNQHAGRGPADLGLLRSAPGAPAGLLAVALVLLFLLDAWADMRSPQKRARARTRWQRCTPFMPQDGRELALFAPLALVAGTTEELLFRGFLIGYLLGVLPAFPSAPALAVALAALPFGLAHLYQGPGAAAKIALGGILLGILYLLSGSLLLAMLVHTLVDLLAGWLSVALLRDAPRNATS